MPAHLDLHTDYLLVVEVYIHLDLFRQVTYLLTGGRSLSELGGTLNQNNLIPSGAILS